MKIVVLCGGIGTRLGEYSFPKPLNMINGKPSISYCLSKLPDHVTTIHFIAAPHLAKYNFEEIIHNQFKTKTCKIHWIPYFTRGPVETAWLGTTEFDDSDETIVFLDNDVVYNFPTDFFNNRECAFIGHATEKTDSEAYSFLTIENGKVINFVEKKRISDQFCCGVYGFKDIQQFRTVARAYMEKSTDKEFYMSGLFALMLQMSVSIQAIKFEGDVFHIGSLKELDDSWPRITKPSMRVCFDLDNTLVTYPLVPGDYSTVKPVNSMICLARQMKAEGHTIIIHTARRMVTHKHNVGAVIKDIGALTFKTLEDFDIPFDELLFGKPIADMYIDDRAVNPYRDSVQLMGYMQHEITVPLNMLPTNKYNSIRIVDKKVYKIGPTKYLRGEIFFYENIPVNTSICNFFPKFYGSSVKGDRSELYIEAIQSIPFYTLFKQGLINGGHIKKLFEFIDNLHNIPGDVPCISDMRANYTDKLRDRFSICEDYPFSDAAEIQEKILLDLSSYSPVGVAFIHGDLWFSNILVDFNGALKYIDMKGQVNAKLHTGGDRMYDYGKLYQSFLGYDAILYGDNLDETYRSTMTDLFISESRCRGIDIDDLCRVTKSLVIGTVSFIENDKAKQRVWDFLKSI